MGHSKQDVGPHRNSDTDQLRGPKFAYHGEHVARMLVDRVGPMQRVRATRPAWIDGDNPELVAEALEDRLEHGQSERLSANEEQRDVTRAMLIIGDARQATPRESEVVALFPD